MSIGNHNITEIENTTEVESERDRARENATEVESERESERARV